MAALVGAALGSPLAVRAQSAERFPRIGVLLPGSAPSASQPSRTLDAFRQGLREHGYVEGRNIALEFRFADGREQRLPELAAELVRLNVAAIVTASFPAIQAAQRATTTIPIVIAAVGDPVGAGLVGSLARPGGNVTGLSLLDTELSEKRLELLRDLLPGLSHVAALWSPSDRAMATASDRVARAAGQLGLRLSPLPMRDTTDIPAVFEIAGRTGVEALVVIAQPFTLRHRAQIVDLAARGRLPAIYNSRTFTDAGGLMSYGPVLADLYRRAAGYVDKILKGAPPADLPIEQPTRFELVINLKAAKALALDVPPALVDRADEVIE